MKNKIFTNPAPTLVEEIRAWNTSYAQAQERGRNVVGAILALFRAATTEVEGGRWHVANADPYGRNVGHILFVGHGVRSPERLWGEFPEYTGQIQTGLYYRARPIFEPIFAVAVGAQGSEVAEGDGGDETLPAVLDSWGDILLSLEEYARLAKFLYPHFLLLSLGREFWKVTLSEVLSASCVVGWAVEIPDGPELYRLVPGSAFDWGAPPEEEVRAILESFIRLF